jgi:mannosyltransferase OCH1-like enzyme
MRKIIHTYWDKNKPEFVNFCIDSWKKHYPDFYINFMDKEIVINTYPEFETYDKYTPQAFSDILRLKLLYDHGGIWLDSTIFFIDENNRFLKNFESLDENIHGYYVNYFGLYTALENWFIGVTNEKNPNVKKWLEKTIENYEKDKIFYKFFIFSNYLRQHVAYMECFGDTYNNKYCYESIFSMVNSNSISFAYNLLKNYNVKNIKESMVKIGGPHRCVLNYAIDKNIYDNNSILAQIIKNKKHQIKNTQISKLNLFSKIYFILYVYFISLIYFLNIFFLIKPNKNHI